ncbi:hypothetical protein AB0O34_10025 [Sphaerisporangium sp. NPDC088356]|uniref:hypothetical protein n=1 Tax=Sphaerisporangium sp. NPDC088356 TaxID=3154871 RepID=UPI003416F5FF
MPHPKSTPDTPPRGWHIFRSDKGRLWATRDRPFSDAEDKAGAWRTVDADDELALAREIAKQESIAELAAVS